MAGNLEEFQPPPSEDHHTFYEIVTNEDGDQILFYEEDGYMSGESTESSVSEDEEPPDIGHIFWDTGDTLTPDDKDSF